MRFSAPRSASPSPTRRHHRSRSTFGAPSESSEDEFEESESQSESESASGSDDSQSVSSTSSVSTDSFCYRSESQVPPLPPRPRRPQRSLSERRYIEDAMASIRLRANHHDPYEEWERETKQEAFRSARLGQSMSKVHRHQEMNNVHTEEAQRRALMHQKQVEEVQARVTALDLRRRMEEQKLREMWDVRRKRQWERIEAVIKFEEDKVKARLEAERKKREEEERRRREEEERKRQEEERKSREEEERKRKQEAEEEEKNRKEQEETEQQQRKSLGFSTAMDDWKRARDTLRLLKSGPMKAVKADKALKSVWSTGRRAITPKVGQLTNDPQAIAKISQQIIGIVRPSPAHPQTVYLALLSSLAKAIFLQSEIEVTAEKHSAGPLAQVAANLLSDLDGFADIFWAKLCQRAGGWPVPVVVPTADSDGTPFSEEQRAKALGYRNDESTADLSTRVSGIMRVYFHILSAPVARPLDPILRLPRYWSYFARMLSEPQLLQSPVAPSILHVALDVGGVEARDVWGQQWVKLLGLLYEGVTTGLHGSKDQLIGGTSAEGIAARVRVQLEVERILSDS